VIRTETYSFQLLCVELKLRFYSLPTGHQIAIVVVVMHSEASCPKTSSTALHGVV